MRPVHPAAPSRRTVLSTVPVLAGALTLAGAGGCSYLDGAAPGSLERALRRMHSLPTDARATTPPADITTSHVAAEAVAALSEGLLTQRLENAPTANALASPVGINLTLAMLYAQAEVLGPGVGGVLGEDASSAPLSATERDTMWRRVQLALQRFDTSSVRELEAFDPQELPDKPLLHLASNVLLVGDAKEVVNQDYVDAVRAWYDSPVSTVALEHASKALDAWASLHTGGMIKSSGIQVSPDLRLVVQNALLLAARWALPFDPSNTLESQPFHLPGGKQVSADLMEVSTRLALVEETGWRAVRVPYAASDAKTQTAGGLAVDVILPDEPVPPTALAPGTWAQATRALSEVDSDGLELSQVRLRLPRLDLTTEAADIMDQLAKMGVRLESVEHIGSDLAVGQTTQQVRMVVDEEGTVAAALTEGAVSVSAPVPPEGPAEFFVDHPYVLRVVDTSTQVTVFEAVIMDPSSRSAL